ncbi:cupin domain-containing protein [Sulfurimonas diazotrophicus]|uniref:Cupin domain-containing protein n=1 Tax=Sulfurimonas diazotrophicus TaxID=3131939 RepID=A0ABZ3HDZ1_9BACT
MPVVSITNSDHYGWGENCDGWHLAASANLNVIRERMPQGASETRHLHSSAEQFFYILSGIATLEVSGEIYLLAPGEGFHIPAGIAHSLNNEHVLDLEFLVVSTPPSHGDRVDA